MTRVVVHTISYSSDEMQFQGYKAVTEETNRTGSKPGVLVAHTAIGPHDRMILDAIKEFAAAGYVAFALDMYGAPKTVTGAEKEACQAPYREERTLIAKHAGAALKVLQGMDEVDESRIAAVGYCFGGQVVLDLARTGADLNLVISYHGVLDRLNSCPKGDPYGEPVHEDERDEDDNADNETDDAGVTVKPKIIVFHGYVDPFTNPRNLNLFIRELEDMGANYEVRVCGSRVLHGFMRPGKPEQCIDEGKARGQRKLRMAHHPRVAKDSWDATISLLSQTFMEA